MIAHRAGKALDCRVNEFSCDDGWCIDTDKRFKVTFNRYITLFTESFHIDVMGKSTVLITRMS